MKKTNNHTTKKNHRTGGGNGKQAAGKNGGMNRKATALTGALIGAALGVAAGLLIPPKAGKKIKQHVKSRSAEFYRYLSPRIKKLKTIGEKEYRALVDQAAKSYGEIKDISAKEIADLAKSAKDSWKDMSKNI